MHRIFFVLYILRRVSALLSHRQGEPDTGEETSLETQIYVLVKMCKKCVYKTLESISVVWVINRNNRCFVYNIV